MVVHHHSDLVWRRTKQGYDKVREKQIFQVLDFMRRHPHFRFTIAQSDIFKTFFRQHPELKDEIKKLVAERRLETVGGIVSIPDTNMVSGESLARNILLGKEFYRKTFGVEVKIAWFADAFGLNGQLPQILKQSGFVFLFPGRMPGLPPDEKFKKGFVWKGIDGSGIITAHSCASLETGQYLCNVPVVYSVDERFSLTVDNLRHLKGDNFVLLCTEEGLFQESIFEKMDALNKKGGIRCGFAFADEYFTRLYPEKLPEFSGEFNPTFTGCYTSRIGLKQLNRRAENLLTDTEFSCLTAHCADRRKYPLNTFDRLWEKMAICQFHDAICGCHIDEVTRYLEKGYADILRQAGKLLKESIAARQTGKKRAQAGYVLFNSLSWQRKDVLALKKKPGFVPAACNEKTGAVQECGEVHYITVTLPPLSRSYYTYRKGTVLPTETVTDRKKLQNIRFETEFYRVSGEKSNLRIEPKFIKKSPMPAEGFGDMFFREDLGDLWTESFVNPLMGRDFYREEIVKVITGPVVNRVILNGCVPLINRDIGFYKLWDGVQHLSWEKELTFFHELKRFEMQITLRWKGRNTLIGICFPTGVNPLRAEAVYAIPFGSIRRSPYYEVPFRYRDTAQKMFASDSHLATAKGAWPALNWVDYSDDRSGLTVANRGTPGHQLNAGRIIIHLLRSLTKKTPGLQPGKPALENGIHRFSFAFLPHPGKVNGEGARMAEEFNNPCTVEKSGIPQDFATEEKPFLTVSNPDVILSACKLSQDRKGIVVRFYEPLGKKAAAAISFNVPVKKIYLSDLQETRITETKKLQIDFKPFEIKTLLAEIQ